MIVISSDYLEAAYDIDRLGSHCMLSEAFDNDSFVKVVDSTGDEFWYSPEHFCLSPGMAFKKWTKKRIIDLYNNSSNVEENNKSYSVKSFSNKRLSRIISDICELLL